MTLNKTKKNYTQDYSGKDDYNELSELINIIKNNPNIDIDLIIYAKNFAKKYHKGQTRISGEPFYLHSIEVSTILASVFEDQDTIIAAILHDIVEDTKLVLPQIGIVFGKRIKYLVDKLTKLDEGVKKLRLAKNETFNKLSKFSEHDKCVSYIKLADRIHNMRTLNFIPSKEKRFKIARETLKIFVPLAKYLKIDKFAQELENLSYEILAKF